MPKHDGLFVRYCAKDFLDGTNQLKAMEELAYRRICDLIYSSSDLLLDDDEALSNATKTYDEWPSIKRRLLALGKITLEPCPEGSAEGFNRIRNARCSYEIGLVQEARASGARGGRKTAESGKSLGNLRKAPSKGTPEGSPRRLHEANHLTTKPLNQEEDSPLSPPFGGNRKSRLFPDWEPGGDGRRYAMEHSLKGDRLSEEIEKFRDHHSGKGNLMVDWSAAWRTWVRNAEKFSPKRQMAFDTDDAPMPSWGS